MRRPPRSPSKSRDLRERAGSRSGRAAARAEHPASARSPASILDRQPWNDLGPHLLRAGADPAFAVPALRRFSELLIDWNHNVSNLISRNDEPRLVVRHLLESIEPAHWLEASGARRWLDFGSGAGLPAIPLAIAGIGDTWTLVESRRRKTLFVRRATGELGLARVRVICARLEKLHEEDPELPGSFDGFTSRATLPLGPTLAMAARFVAPGGVAFLWKGSRRDAELAGDSRWSDSWRQDEVTALGSGLTVVAKFVRK